MWLESDRSLTESAEKCNSPYPKVCRNILESALARRALEAGDYRNASTVMDAAFETFADLAAAARKPLPADGWTFYLSRGKIRHALGNLSGARSDLRVSLDVCKRVLACAGSITGEGEIHEITSFVLFDLGNIGEAAAECLVAAGFGLSLLPPACAFMRGLAPQNAGQPTLDPSGAGRVTRKPRSIGFTRAGLPHYPVRSKPRPQLPAIAPN